MLKVIEEGEVGKLDIVRVLTEQGGEGGGEEGEMERKVYDDVAHRRGFIRRRRRKTGKGKREDTQNKATKVQRACKVRLLGLKHALPRAEIVINNTCISIIDLSRF